MKILPWFRFGLPLGTALILCAFLETVISSYEACTDVISVFIVHWNTDVGKYMSETPTIILLNVVIFLQITADILCLWFGAICKGNKISLIAWIVTTMVTVVVLSGVWIDYLFTQQEADALEYKNALISTIYTITIYTLFYAYLLAVAFQCLPHLNENLEEVQPIGKGFGVVWRFFARNPINGAKALLISELVFNCYFFISRKLPSFIFERFYSGHEGDYTAPLIIEEFVLRGMRVLLDFVGIFLIVMGRNRMMRYWSAVYFAMIVISFGIFCFLVIEWSAEHVVLTYGYLFYFVINICFRAVILFVCLLFAQLQESSDFAFVAEFN